MSEKLVQGISCPSCGGGLEIKEGKATAYCPFCDSGHIIKGERGITRYYVKETVTPIQVKQKAFEWLSGVDKDPYLKDSYKIEDITLIFVPFFRIKTRGVGWVLGRLEHRSKSGTDYSHIEKKIDHEFDWNVPACNIEEMGIRQVNLRGGNVLLPYDIEYMQSRGMVFDITNSLENEEDRARGIFEDWALAQAKVDHITFRKLHLLRWRTSIVYYPLWVLRYRYRDRIYQLVFDAEKGDLLSGKAPGNNYYRVAMLVGTMFIGNFFLTTSLRSYHDGDPIFFLGIFAGVIIYVGYRSFRYGAEVRYYKDQFDATQIISQQISRLAGMSLWEKLKEPVKWDMKDLQRKLESLTKK